MFDNIIHIIYFLIHEYIDIKSLLFVSKSIQKTMNQNGYVKYICYDENNGNIQTFIERCSKHHCLLDTIKYMNIKRPFKSDQFTLSNVNTIILDSCYITDQLNCVRKSHIKELVLRDTDMYIARDFPQLTNLLCHDKLAARVRSFHDNDKLAMLSTTLQELCLFCKYRIRIAEITLPNLKTVMIHGTVKTITSPHLQNVVCTTIGEQTFISMCVNELNLFINGFGIYYKQLPKHLLDKLAEWEDGANKHIREMCKYIHLSNYKHTWESGITPTQFMKSVIHKYSYKDSTIIYRGVKKLAVIPKDGKYHWGFEEIVFNP